MAGKCGVELDERHRRFFSDIQGGAQCDNEQLAMARFCDLRGPASLDELARGFSRQMQFSVVRLSDGRVYGLQKIGVRPVGHWRRELTEMMEMAKSHKATRPNAPAGLLCNLSNKSLFRRFPRIRPPADEQVRDIPGRLLWIDEEDPPISS